MVQLAMPHKLEDLSLIQQDTCREPGGVVHICSPSAPEAETERPLKLQANEKSQRR